MSARRQVRVAPSFFDRLDELLPAERTDSGTPSTGDFLFYELPPLMDALAEDHRSVTLAVEGLEQVRVLIAAGTTGSSPPPASSKVLCFAAAGAGDRLLLLTATAAAIAGGLSAGGVKWAEDSSERERQLLDRSVGAIEPGPAGELLLG